MRWLALLTLVACGRTLPLRPPPRQPPDAGVTRDAGVPAPPLEPCATIDVSVLYRLADGTWCGVSGVAMLVRQFNAMAAAHPACSVGALPNATHVLNCDRTGVIPSGATADKCGWTLTQDTCLDAL